MEMEIQSAYETRSKDGTTDLTRGLPGRKENDKKKRENRKGGKSRRNEQQSEYYYIEKHGSFSKNNKGETEKDLIHFLC